MEHFWHATLYYFKKQQCIRNAEKICAVYGASDVTDRMCQKWFMKFLGTIDILGK